MSYWVSRQALSGNKACLIGETRHALLGKQGMPYYLPGTRYWVILNALLGNKARLTESEGLQPTRVSGIG